MPALTHTVGAETTPPLERHPDRFADVPKRHMVRVELTRHPCRDRPGPADQDRGWTKQRQDNAAFLSANLEGVTPPPVADGAVHVYHQYTIRVPQDRDGLAKALREEYNIGSGMFYPIPNHQLAPFRADVDLPETAKAAAECLSLPVHPSLSQDDLERIVAAVNALAKAGA
jgi:dTDP-4-amino-4,6-dideoxygalactose transaminase